MAQLILSKEGKPILKRLLDSERFVIGRDRSCDLQFLEPAVSRTHCVIERKTHGYFLKDSSRNGTFLQGKKIETAPLRDGDRIEIGPWQMVFAIGGRETASETVVENRPKPEGDSRNAMMGNSPAMHAVFREIDKAAASEVPVSLVGESGTGKELAARRIHALSKRSGKPFVAINCGAIPANLIESMLFGHERGAFTGAAERHLGVFEQAHGGTLFLDEIGEMPIELQTRLLRVLESRTLRRIGGREEIPVDVRLITATLRDLKEEAANGGFREDLFFRLYIFPIELPPLRRRREDVEKLAGHFLETLSAGEKKPVLTPAGLEKLKNYDWPGNVRELKNVLQRALLSAEGVIEPEHLELTYLGLNKKSLNEANLSDQEKVSIVEALRKSKGNRSEAARLLGIARTTLASKLRRYKMKSYEWL